MLFYKVRLLRPDEPGLAMTKEQIRTWSKELATNVGQYLRPYK